MKPETKFKIDPTGNAMKRKTRPKGDLSNTPVAQTSTSDMKESPQAPEEKEFNSNEANQLQKTKSKNYKKEKLMYLKSEKVYDFYENDKGEQIVRNIRENKNRTNRAKLASNINEQYKNDNIPNENTNNFQGMRSCDAITEHHSPFLNKVYDLDNDIDSVGELLPESMCVNAPKNVKNIVASTNQSKHAEIASTSEHFDGKNSKSGSILQIKSKKGPPKQNLNVSVQLLKPLTNNVAIKGKMSSEKKILVGGLKKREIQNNNSEVAVNILKKQTSMGFHNLKNELQALDSKKSKALDNQQRQNETCQNDLNLVNRATNNQAIALTNKKKLIMPTLKQRKAEAPVTVDESSSSSYDDVEVIKTAEKPISHNIEILKSPPPVDNLAWDLKYPGSPLRYAIRKNKQSDLIPSGLEKFISPNLDINKNGKKSTVKIQAKNKQNANYQKEDSANSWDSN